MEKLQGNTCVEHSRNIPKLRFPEFNGEWEKKKLGEVATFSKGKGICKADIIEDGKTECIRYGELYTHYGETINEIKSKTNIDFKELVISEANDVIIPASGETQIDIATASCVLKSGIALGGDLNIIKTVNNGVFLSYYLNSKKKYDIANLAQGISVVHLYSSQLALLELNLPTLPEQTRIATFFTVIDQKIAQLKQKKNLLEQYKKGVMQKLFSQELRFRNVPSTGSGTELHSTGGVGVVSTGSTTGYAVVGEEVPSTSSGTGYAVVEEEVPSTGSGTNSNNGSSVVELVECSTVVELVETTTGKEFPEWEMKKLGEVCEKKSSNISANKIEDNYGDFIIYGASGVLKKIDFYQEENDYVSIIKDGAGVGRIVYCKGKSSVLGTMEIIKPKIQLNTYFLFCLLENIDFAKYVTGSTIPHIYFKDYKNENCDIPCLAEQTLIANFLSTLDEKINQVAELVEATEQWKKGLLQQMFC